MNYVASIIFSFPKKICIFKRAKIKHYHNLNWVLYIWCSTCELYFHGSDTIHSHCCTWKVESMLFATVNDIKYAHNYTGKKLNYLQLNEKHYRIEFYITQIKWISKMMHLNKESFAFIENFIIVYLKSISSFLIYLNAWCCISTMSM